MMIAKHLGKAVQPKVIDPSSCVSLSQKAPVKFDMAKLCKDISGLATLSPAKWKVGCTDVFNRIMNDKALDEHLTGTSGCQAKNQLSKAFLNGFEHFQKWQQEELMGKMKELLGDKDSKGKWGNANWKSKDAGSSWKDKQKASWKAKEDKKATVSFKDKMKKGWSSRRNPQKTEANLIEVNWKAPKKEDTPASASSPPQPMSAGPSAPSRGPAGRGRGTSVPAWMTAGIGQSATAEVDKATPAIPEQPKQQEQDEPEEDLLAETFAERDVSAADRLAAKKSGGKGGWRRGGLKWQVAASRGGSGGKQNRGSGGGGWKKKSWW